MKMHLNVTLRIPGRLQYQFFEIPDIGLEIDVPNEHVMGYPNDERSYLTPKGLSIVERELDRVLREESPSKVKEEEVVEINDEDVEEGW